MRCLEESGVMAEIDESFPNFMELLLARASEKPKQPAYIFLRDGENESDHLTYAELDRRARMIAARLQAMDMAGERALLLYPPGLEYIEAFFGCLYAGVIAVPAYPPTRQHLPRLQAIIRDATPAVVLTTESLFTRFRDDLSAYGMPDIPCNGERSAHYEWLTTDKLGFAGAECWKAPTLPRDSLAFLQYTSGSTGDPKGVMVSHGNLLTNQEAIKRGFRHTDHSTVVGWLPLYHDMGLIGNILQPLYVGSTAILMPPMAFLEKPIRWLRAISAYRAATSGGPNFAYELCVRKVTQDEKRDLDLSCWTLAFNGSEPVRAATLDRFAETFSECGFRRESLFPCYGLAEATLFVTGEKLQNSTNVHQTQGNENTAEENQREFCNSVSCGPSWFGHEVRIVDPQSRQICLSGQEGEIWISGSSVAQGYWNRPEESEEIFRARIEPSSFRPQLVGDRTTDTSNQECEGPFLRTGDLGVLSQGRLHITGRIKDLIIIRGRNYYPQDIEQNLTDGSDALRSGGCAAFSVIGRDGECLVVVAELTREATRKADYDGVFSSLRSVLADRCELTVAELVLVQPGAVPKTSSGKLRRQACKQAYLENVLPVLARTGEVLEAAGIDPMVSSDFIRKPQAESHTLIPFGTNPPKPEASEQRSPVGFGEIPSRDACWAQRPNEGKDRKNKSQGDTKGMPEPELQLLREALSAVPVIQRSALISRFLRNIVSRLLKLDAARLSEDKSLRSLGLDSLKAIELKYAVDELLGIEAPLTLFLSDLSVADAAKFLANQSDVAGSTTLTVPEATYAGCDDTNSRTSASSCLSATQLSMWAMQHMEPDSIVYNLHLALRFESLIDAGRLRQCFVRLAERHDILRTIYFDEDGRVVQKTLPLSELPDFFSAIDATTWSDTDLQDDMGRRVREPFDLEQGPVFRVTIYRHGLDIAGLNKHLVYSVKSEPISHTLLLCAHHIALDLWSVLLLVGELVEIYDELAKGQALVSSLAVPSYATFAAWQRCYLDSLSADEDWEYWRNRLAGELPILSLPVDRLGPTVPEYRGASVPMRVSCEEADRLKTLAKQQGVTLFTLLLAAYKVLLYRYTHQNDLIVGVPTSGRSQARFAPIAGNFVNPVPLRTFPSGDNPFSDYLAQVHSALLGAMEHQNFPFSLMVERLKVERTPGYWPIYQTLFVLQQAQADTGNEFAQISLGENGTSLVRGDWKIHPLSIHERVENFGLKLMAAECRDGIIFSFQFRTDHWDTETVERLAQHFSTLLRGIVVEPATCLSELPLLSEAERGRALDAWNATAADYPKGSCLHELIEVQATKSPDAVAVACGEKTFSYGELNARATQLAHHLRGLGVGLEVKVGLCLERSVEAIIGMLAVLKAGGAYVPLDPGAPPERIAEILADCGALVLLTQDRWLQRQPTFATSVLCLDWDWSTIAGHPTDVPPTPAQPANAAYVIYTSGSTGKPKGVVVSHGNAVASTFARFQFYPQAPDGFLLLSPFAFDSSVAGIFWTLSQGGRLCIPQEGMQQDAEALAELIARERLSHILCLPSLYSLLLEAAQPGQLSPLRAVIVAGEACPSVLPNRHFQCLPATRLYNEYGPTEGTVWSSADEIRAEDAETGRPVSIGQPIANTRIYLLDAHFDPVPIGVPGELYIGGAGVARNYHDRPDMTAERFMPDPFGGEVGGRLYRSGDLARWRANGHLEFMGRMDYQIKIRGFRIELGEIESRLLEHPGVRETAVIAREDSPGSNKRLVAYWVPVTDTGKEHTPRAEALKTFLKAGLPDYMVPSAFVPLTQLPRTVTGKIDRAALPSPDWSEQLVQDYIAPSTPVETRLAAIWSDVLRLERVGIHDNFFSLGGDSILAIQTVSRARQAGLQLTPRQLFQHQTVAELATVTCEALEPQAQLQAVTGDVPLTPIQRWFFEQPLSNPHHWNQAVMLEANVPLDGERLKRAIDYLVAHHDAFRLRFSHDEIGWRQQYAATQTGPVFLKEDLSGVTDADLSSVIETRAEAWQKQLDITAGPLLRVVLFETGEGRSARLLIVVHHLAVDGVSWRILLDDLHAVYRQLSENQTPTLPPKTASYKTWSEYLHTLAQSQEIQDEANYWQHLSSCELPVFSVDNPEGSRAEGRTDTYTIELSEPETLALLREASAAYRTEINELLLAALAQTLASRQLGDTVWIDLEGHGREDGHDDLDLSRTVGWFTSVFPVRLNLPQERTSAAVIKAVKEQLRSVPRKGLGFGLLRHLQQDSPIAPSVAPVLFNYLGQFDAILDATPFVPARESVGTCQDSAGVRAYELEINALVKTGRLCVEWRYGLERYRSETVVELAEAYLAALKGLIAHCLSPEAGGLTASDFPLARLSQAELDGLSLPPREVEDIYPLSPMQEGMLFHTLVAPNSGIYLMQDRFDIQGHVDPKAFGKAWQKIVDRHSALRVSFAWDGLSRPRQIVHRKVILPFEYLDWRNLTEAEQRAQLDELLQREREQGFDFHRPPLMRIRLLRLGEDRYRFVRSYHHILVDAWCTSLILTELKAHYAAIVEGQMCVSTSPPAFREYLAWLDRQDEVAAERYWRETLEGFAEPTELRLPASQIGVDDGVADAVAWMDESTTEELQALARSHHLTTNTFLQAAWALTLVHYSGREDVLFGITVSGRPTDLNGCEHMLGVFINSLPLRVRLKPEQRVLGFLESLVDQNLALRQYEYLPLLRIQSLSEIPRERALFDSLLVFENYPIDPSLRSDDNGLHLTGVEVRTHTNYPLTVTVIPGTRLEITITYGEKHFEKATVEHLLASFQQLLESMVRQPHARLAELSPMTRNEWLCIEEWNRTERAWDWPWDFVKRFRAQVERSPDAVAALCEKQQITYAELAERARRIAHGLRGRGVGPETLVAVLDQRGLDFLSTVVGILESGGAYLPLDPSHPDARIQEILKDSECAFLLSGDNLLERAAFLANGLMPIQVFSLNEIERAECSNDSPRGRGHQLAYVIYTSGSTGKPKGVMVERAGMLNNLLSKVPVLELTERDVIAQTASQCFDISVWQFLTALLCGARVAIFPDEVAKNPLRLLDELSRCGVTVLESVPSLIRALLDAPPVEIPTLRWLLPTGEAMPPELCRRWLDRHPRVKLLNAYGPAECSDDVAYYAVPETVSEQAANLPVGRAVDNNRLYVMGPWMQPSPIGVAGELCVAGVGVGRGYLRRPDLTAEKFIPDPFVNPDRLCSIATSDPWPRTSTPADGRLYRTGDLARWSEDGQLEFLGRSDYQVKIRGFRIELGEIESRLAQHPGVNEALVLAHEVAPGISRLIVYWTPVSLDSPGSNEIPSLEKAKPNGDTDNTMEPIFLDIPPATEDLRSFLKTLLPDYMLPASYVMLEKLPLTPNGKIDRKALPQAVAATQLEKPHVAPRNPTEEILCSIWKDLLGQKNMGVEDNFFDLGGHSLIAVQMLSRVRAAFGIEISLRRVFEASTISQLATVIEECLIEQIEALTEEESLLLLEGCS